MAVKLKKNKGRKEIHKNKKVMIKNKLDKYYIIDERGKTKNTS